MKGVILSRTEMKGGYFCSNVACEIHGQWRQVRPLLGPNQHLHQDAFGRFSYLVNANWQPRRRVVFEPVNPQPYPRPTHPEDLVINPRGVHLPEPVDEPRFRQIIRHFTYDSFAVLYPGIRRQYNGGAYVSEPPAGQSLSRSVGYVRDCRVEILPEERIKLCDASDFEIASKIKDAETLARLRSGELKVGVKYKEALIRLSLAAPWARPDEDGKPCTEPRCYVMFSGFGN